MQGPGQQTNSNYSVQQCVVSSIQAHSYVRVVTESVQEYSAQYTRTHATQSSTGRKKGETWAA